LLIWFLLASHLATHSFPTRRSSDLGAIEFGNRLLTFVLAAIAVLTILALWRLRKTHRSLFVMSIVLFLVIPAQAVIGGITVWTGDRKSTRLNSSHVSISYAVFCLKN